MMQPTAETPTPGHPNQNPDVTPEQVERLHFDQLFAHFMEEREKWITHAVMKVIPGSVKQIVDPAEQAAAVRAWLTENGYHFAPIHNGFSLVQNGEVVSCMKMMVQYAERQSVIQIPSVITPMR